MMEGAAGRALTDDAVSEAVAFRREVASAGRRLPKAGHWWFSAFQPAEFTELDQDAWQLAPGEAWHGYRGLRIHQAMLDPVKVTLVTPGISPDGRPQAWGIPAGLVAAFLRSRGVVVEKTGYYSILVLFSIAVTRGKSGTLLAELFDFHRAYEANMPLAEALPEVCAEFGDRYAGIGLKDLAAQMHEFLSGYDTARMQEAISERLPEPAMTPAEAFGKLVRGETDLVPLDQLTNRVSAVTCLLYPPGIPVVVPGERFTDSVRPIVEYLQLFEHWDSQFPGFENEVQGVVRERSADGTVRFSVSCVTE
jgi:arginine decarboxylase